MKTGRRQTAQNIRRHRHAGARHRTGQAKNPRVLPGRAFFSLVFFFVLLAAMSAAVRADDLEEIKRLDEQVAQQKKNIETVQSGIDAQQGKVEESRKREMALLEELARIDEQLAAEEGKLRGFTADMAKQDKLTRDKKQQSDKLSRDKERLRQHMGKRLAAYYRTGDIGLMNAVFSAESLSELLLIEDGFRFMLHHDRGVVNGYKETLAALEAALTSHEAETKRLGQMAELVRDQQKRLAGKQQERQGVLERVQTEKALYQQAVAELAQAARELTDTLKTLEGQARKAKSDREMQLLHDYPLKAFKKRKPVAAQGFAAEKGKLPLPAQGAVVRFFKQVGDERGEATAGSNGIDIDCPPGSDIHAIYGGKVVYAGAMRGYGNLIIIDHANRYYSLVSGIGEILVKVGDAVRQHDTIGKTSLHTGELREGLHLEIRHNTRPQDPLPWIDPTRLTVNAPPGQGDKQNTLRPASPLSGERTPARDPVAK